MFWIIYLFAATLLSYLIAKSTKKYQFESFVLVLITFITPSKIEISGLDYAPSIYAFIYNIFLEQNFSSRVLRPLILSLPAGLLFLIIYSNFKRKFF